MLHSGLSYSQSQNLGPAGATIYGGNPTRFGFGLGFGLIDSVLYQVVLKGAVLFVVLSLAERQLGTITGKIASVQGERCRQWGERRNVRRGLANAGEWVFAV